MLSNENYICFSIFVGWYQFRKTECFLCKGLDGIIRVSSNAINIHIWVILLRAFQTYSSIFLGNGSIFLLHFLFFKLFGLFCWCHPKMSDKCVWSIGRFVMTNKKDACSKRPMDHVSSDQFQF